MSVRAQAPTMELRTTLAYRPEFDGIRGLAVLLVVAAHAGYPHLRAAGQVGVTLFFVLSGFLITSLLRAELARSGRIDLRAFYVRRAKRLLPALALLLTVAGVVGWATVPTLVAIALYVGNWYREAGNSIDMLGHTWSLAIEEQFYVVWPLLFIAGLRSPRVLLVLAGAAAAWRLAATGDFSTSTFARADGLLLGCAIAWWRAAPRWAAPIGLAGLAVAAVLPFGWSVTLATAGSGLLVGSAPHWLAVRTLVRLGAISYALYLWHFPLIYATGWPLWVSVPASFAVAWASTRFWESRFRSGIRRDNDTVTALVAALRARLRPMGNSPPGPAAGTRVPEAKEYPRA